MNVETVDSGRTTVDYVVSVLGVLDESFGIFLPLGGAFVALLAVLVFFLTFCLIVTELQEARR